MTPASPVVTYKHCQCAACYGLSVASRCVLCVLWCALFDEHCVVCVVRCLWRKPEACGGGQPCSALLVVIFFRVHVRVRVNARAPTTLKPKATKVMALQNRGIHLRGSSLFAPGAVQSFLAVILHLPGGRRHPLYPGSHLYLKK